MKNPFLVGTQVYLRAHEESDLVEWASWFNDPEVTKFLEQGLFPNTAELQRQRLASLYGRSDHLQVAVVDKKTDALAGTIGLHGINPWNRHAEISIIIGNRACWGKRFGREAVSLMVQHAFVKLGLHKIAAGMVDTNQASYRLFEELGFKKEAALKEHLFIGGEFRDSIRMCLFKKDWKKS